MTVRSGVLQSGTHVTWIKGKWNELTKGDRYGMWSDEKTGQHFLELKHPKQSDSGAYKVKVVTPKGDEECSFQVAVGRTLH